MFTLSNTLSMLRAPLAFLFLVESPFWRIVSIVLAMFTDALDGYLARRSLSTTRFGAVLDPAMDKFFVLFALVVFFCEGRLAFWAVFAMLARDFFLCIFGIYLHLSGKWQTYECRSVRFSKMATALQFFVLVGLTLGYAFPWYLYVFLVLFGLLAFLEFCEIKMEKAPS